MSSVLGKIFDLTLGSLGKTFLQESKAASLSMPMWQKLHDRDLLSRYMPYYMYDKEESIYHNNNETYGVMFEISPRLYAGKQTADTMREILAKLSPGMTLQTHFVGSKNENGAIDEWEYEHKARIRSGELDPKTAKIVSKTIERVAGFFKEKLHESISKQMTTHIKDFRVYISVISTNYDELKEFKTTLRNFLDGNQFHPKNIAPQELLNLLYELFNSNHSLDRKDMPVYEEKREINRQIIMPDTKIQFTDDYSKIDDRYWINSSPVRYPEYASISDMGMKIGDYITAAMNANQFKDAFIISLSCTKKDDKQLKSSKRNHSIIITQQWSELLFRKFNDVRKESVNILDRIDINKEDLFYVDMNVLISGTSYEEAQKNTAVVTSFWNKGGKTSSIQLAESKGIQQLCFMASMPFGSQEEYLNRTDKGKSMFGEQASQFFPLECDLKGNNGKNLILLSRRGQMQFFDMFISSNNYNGYIIAASGAGKSVFLNVLALFSWARGDRVFILDLGGSFRQLCEIVEGQWIEPDRKNPKSLNPFSEILSMQHLMDEIDFLSTFVYSLGANKNRVKYEENEKLFKSYLQDVIKECFEKYGTDMEVTHIKETLLEQRSDDKNVADFCQQLNMFCRGGVYEPFFAGKCAVDFSGQFVVAELQLIEKEEDLRDALIMMLTYHQSNAIYKQGNQKQRILNIFDEAHKYIGKDPRMDDFIEQGYRRARKQNASFIIATQGFEDIYDSASGKLSRGGKAIINSSSWKFFLKQSETSINLLIKAGVFNMSGHDEELLRSTKTVKGEFSEIFVITPEENKTVCRLIFDEFLYYVTSSDAKDKQKIAQKIEEGYDLEGAIDSLIGCKAA